MSLYGDPIQKLIDEFSRLPSIGYKTAQRLAFHVINMPEENVTRLTNAIQSAKNNIRYCEKCCNLTDVSPCSICSSTKREPNIIMVVEDPRDMAAYERINEYKGLYHVIHGSISPLNGIGPNELKIKELISRIQTEEIEEVILATNPNVEGEATAVYISKLLKTLDVKATRIAHGVPVGGDLEFVDQLTLSRALTGRQIM